MIITNNTEDKEYFNPSNMDKFIQMDCEYKAFVCGSYYLFNRFENFEPHDYDYIIFCKINKDLSLPAFHYHYKRIADFFTVYYNDFSTPDKFINCIINISQKYSILQIANLFNNDILNYFNITYNDLEPYFDQIEEITNKILDKWGYYKEILKYIKENKSILLTEIQLMKCYDIYKNSRNIAE